MINGVGVTEFQLEAHTEWCDDDHQPRGPAAEDKDGADSAVHDAHVMQGFADGHTVVIGHGGQEKKLCYSTEVSEKLLNGTSIICDDLVTCCYIIQVSGNTGRCE